MWVLGAWLLLVVEVVVLVGYKLVNSVLYLTGKSVAIGTADFHARHDSDARQSHAPHVRA